LIPVLIEKNNNAALQTPNYEPRAPMLQAPKVMKHNDVMAFHRNLIAAPSAKM
jgi:hypothetical protein